MLLLIYREVRRKKICCIMINSEIFSCIKWLLLRLKKNGLKLAAIFLLLITYVIIQVFLPILHRDLMDKGLVALNPTYSYKIVCIILVANIGCLIIQQVKEKLRLQIFKIFKDDLSYEAYKHLFDLSYINIETRETTELTITTETDIDMISLITDELFLTLITQIAIFTGAFLGLFYIDYRLALVIVFYIPIKLVISTNISNKNLNCQKKINFCSQIHLGWLGNIISGLKEVRLFGQTNNVLTRYRNRNSDRIDLIVKKSLLNSRKAFVNGFSNDFLTFLIYILGITFAFVYNSLSVGSIIAFVSYTQRVIQSLNFILDSRFVFSNILPSIKRHIAFLSLEEEEKKGDELSEKISQIEFADVHFSYPKGKKVLNGVSFSIKSGDKIGLVGKNGSGKSTIIDLLLGLYRVTHGNIYINSCNLNELRLNSYRQHISVVSQTVHLFNESIKNNITFCQPVDEKHLYELLDLCGLKDFVNKVGLDYNVGVDGCKLSGGQRQKIALARALLKDSDVFIFDEVTSNADENSILLVKNLINNYLKDKIIILLTHNADLIAEMSEIIYLDYGKAYSPSSI